MGFFGVLPLILGLFSGGQESLDLVDTQAYWQLKSVGVTAASMIEELGGAAAAAEAADAAIPATPATPAVPAIDYDALVSQLGAEAFAEREVAQKQLEAGGEAAMGALEKGVKSDDPEVSVRSRKAIDVIRKPVDEPQMGQHRRDMPRPDGPQAKPLRRLMAIRTIGEMKYKEALPLLSKLTDSKATFEAEYAKRAIAAIEDKAYEPPAVDAKLLEADVAAMPAGILGVMQSHTRPGKFNMREMLGLAAGIGHGMPNPDEMLRQATSEMTYAFEQTGNVRVDAITASFGYSKGVEQDALMLVSVRGQFDLAAIRALAKGEGVIEKIGEVDVLMIHEGEGIRLAMISDTHIVVTIHDRQFNPALAEIYAAFRDGKAGGIEKNEALSELVKTVDRKKDSWAAVVTTKEMRQLPVLAAIGSLTMEMAVAEKGVDVLLKARGEDDEQVAQAGRLAEGAYQGLVMKVNQAFQENMPEMPQRQAIMKALQGVRFKNEPGLVTVTGRLEDPMILMQGLPMMFFIGMRAEVQMDRANVEMQMVPQPPQVMVID